MLKRTTVSVSRERTARIAGGGSGPTVTFIDTHAKQTSRYLSGYLPSFRRFKEPNGRPGRHEKMPLEFVHPVFRRNLKPRVPEPARVFAWREARIVHCDRAEVQRAHVPLKVRRRFLRERLPLGGLLRFFLSAKLFFFLVRFRKQNSCGGGLVSAHQYALARSVSSPLPGRDLGQKLVKLLL